MAKKPASSSNSALKKPVQPDEVLAEIVGSTAIPRTEVTKKVWDYIKEHKLQDPKAKRKIIADAKLKAVFNGKAEVDMFEMTKLVNGHLKS